MGIKAPPGAPQRHNNELCWVELCFVVCEYVWRMYVCINRTNSLCHNCAFRYVS